jgi:hypothetical protein
MPGTPLQERLASLRFPTDPSTEREVQRLVWEYVDDRKAEGWLPERVIIAVKQIAREAGLKPSAMIVKRDAKLTTEDDFLVDMVGWCIDRYFRH